ncbi:MAG: LPP20 family lipoprotein [Campylobacterota bacterium]|nr:LPP20 family lipoprotein [Campylobacterota bacterium]
MQKLFLLLTLPIIAFASPSWMFKVEHEKTAIIGYGVGVSLAKAKQSALNDITNYISVKVQSNVKMSSSDVNGKASSNSSSNLQTSSKAQLSGVEYIKIAQEGNLWYVAAKYDNAPLEVKLERLIGQATADEVQNAYLKNTPLIQALNDEMKYTLDYDLIRKDNLWQIKYDNYIVPVGQKDFYRLFSIQNSDEVYLAANQEVYKQNDEMYFNIQHKNPGFISVLYVEHNGKVGVLLENKISRGNFRYPASNSKDIFKVSNPYKKTIYELYIAIYSTESLDLQQFENVGETHLDESNYNFHKLINYLGKHSFSTYAIKIK